MYENSRVPSNVLAEVGLGQALIRKASPEKVGEVALDIELGSRFHSNHRWSDVNSQHVFVVCIFALRSILA